MDVPSIFYLIILIILSGVFSSLEIAFFMLTEAKVDVLIKQKKMASEVVKKLKSDPEKLLTTILIGNNIVNIVVASMATKIALDIFGDPGVAIAAFVITIIILLFGEIIPKAFATAHPKIIAQYMAYPLLFFQYLMFPIIAIFESITKSIMKLFKINRKKQISDDEINAMVRISAREGGIERNEQQLIQNALRFNDIEVGQIMTPRVKMIALNQEKTIIESLSVIQNSNFSRIPVYKGNDDNITGIFYVRDILTINEKDLKKKKLSDMCSKPLFTSESRKIDTLFKEFQQTRIHIAVVLDEHGGTAGIVTLEDIIEELVGEIDDETDKQRKMIKKINTNAIFANGEVEMKEIFDFFKVENIQDEDLNQSLNGFICSKLETIPKTGESLEIHGLIFIVEEATEKIIKKVRIKKLK